jgi:hypothetical protein
MDSPNTLILKSATRDAEFPMDGEGSIWYRKWPIGASRPTHDEVVINIEAELPARKGAIEIDCSPEIVLSWLEPAFQFDDLLHRTIEIPNSYDEFVGDHVTSFHYFDDLDFNDVRIHFVERDGPRYRIKVTRFVPDMQAEDEGQMSIQIDTIVCESER